MQENILDILICPNCKNQDLTINIDSKRDSHIISGEIRCSKCKSIYQIIDSVPIMLSKNKTKNNLNIKENDYRDKQIKYYAEKCDEGFEINRPHNAGRLYQYLIDYKFNKAFKSSPTPITNCTLLDVCCGSGMATEYYAKQGAEVVGSDVSFAAVKRAKRRSQKKNFQSEFVVGDTENLPFKDDSFDFVCVHDGLHHLEKPRSGFRELSRIARKSVFLIEPAKAFLTRISVFLGLSTDYEDAGNFVYRFTKKELKKWSVGLGYTHNTTVRYLMFYPHFPPKWLRLFDNKILFCLFLFCYNFMNCIFGFLGNKILFIAWDKSAQEEVE